MQAEHLADEHNKLYRKKHLNQLYTKYDKENNRWIVVYKEGKEEKVYSE
jgi:hypothetical protein